MLGGIGGLAGVRSRVQPQVGEEDRHALGRERAGGRRADAVVGSGYQCHPAVQPRIDHGVIPAARVNE